MNRDGSDDCVVNIAILNSSLLLPHPSFFAMKTSLLVRFCEADHTTVDQLVEVLLAAAQGATAFFEANESRSVDPTRAYRANGSPGIEASASTITTVCKQAASKLRSEHITVQQD